MIYKRREVVTVYGNIIMPVCFDLFDLCGEKQKSSTVTKSVYTYLR